MGKLGQLTVDVLILNRNLRAVTDALAEALSEIQQVGKVHVIDSGSVAGEISDRTLVRDGGQFATTKGLRINKGFNLGLSKWVTLPDSAEWVLLLPNDAEIISADLARLVSSVEGAMEVVAIVPITEDNPYSPLINETGIALVWNVHEGPLMLRKSFVQSRFKMGGELFDSSNYRSFASFLDLAFQIYAIDRCIVVTNLLRFRENKLHQLTKHELIGTEPHEENMSLFLTEGIDWLSSKFGFTDRRNLELATRLLFEEFCLVHPEISIRPAV